MFLRHVGYTFLEDRKTGNESFVRPLNRGYYPRFHLYLDQLNGRVVLNLHLDQKQASYAGVYAHNAEYDGELVTAEMSRIKELVAGNAQEAISDEENKAGRLDQIRPKQFNAVRQMVEKRSWWRKFFR